MTAPRNPDVKASPLYPARIDAGDAIAVENDGGIIAVSLDVSSVPDAIDISTPADHKFLAFNEQTGVLERVGGDQFEGNFVSLENLENATAEAQESAVAAEAAAANALAAGQNAGWYDSLAAANSALGSIPANASIQIGSADAPNTGIWVKQSGVLVKKTTVTVPGLDFRTAQMDSAVTKLSDWMLPVRDAAGRLAGGLTRRAEWVLYRLFADTLTGTDNERQVGVYGFRGMANRRGRWFWSISDSALRLSIAVRRDGAFFAAKILPYQDADLYNIVAAGDSLTAGAGATGGNTYPAQLAALLGRAVTNTGVGGQYSTQIAGRIGAPFAMTISGNTIVAGSNTVTHFDGVAVASMSANAAAPQPLSTAADNVARTLTIVFCGVRGTLTRTASGGPPSTAEVYTFTPDGNQTLPVKCPPGSIAVADRATDDSKITAIWVGRNGYGAGGAQAAILADVAAIVGRLQGMPKRFVVLSILNADGETAGGSNYNTILAINTALQRAYADNFIDVRRLLVAAYNSGVPQDVTDYGNDVPPSSLRSDTVHLNNAGYAIVAQAVAQFIIRKGW